MASTTVKVLVSSAGRRVELVQCFRAAAAELRIPIEIIACDAEPELSSACQIADKSFKVPPCSHKDFIAAVAAITLDEGVQLVVPTIDPELLPFALAATEFAKNGTRIHVSDASVIGMARDKLETMRTLGAAGVPVPRTAGLEEVRARPDDWSWPLFVKPTSGSASRLISKVDEPSDLPLAPPEPMIVQEFLDGAEFTVNIFISATGELKCAVAHHRLRVRAGEVEKGLTVRNETLSKIARSIAAALPGASGVLCFQVIDSSQSGPRVIEVNARFGGGYPLAHHAGATFTRWLIEETLGHPSTAHDNWREGVLMLRYDAAVFQG